MANGTAGARAVAVLTLLGAVACAPAVVPRAANSTPPVAPPAAGRVAVDASSAPPGDADDPLTWARQLGDPRTRQGALDRLADMDVERARPAVPALIDLYRDTRRTEHLEALARYHDGRTTGLLIEALDYSDDDYDRAAIAAGALGDMKASEAVDALIAAAAKPLPVRSRANIVRMAAIRALVRIGDTRAVPTLARILTTPADEQDFILNMKAALGLAQLRDASSVPALLKGLFMTGRGTNTFQECRLALVGIGDPAVEPLMALFDRKVPEVEAMAKEQSFDRTAPGAIRFKAALVLGDLRAQRAVPILQAGLKKKQQGNEHLAMVTALGLIATPPAVDTLLSIVKDARADVDVRAAAADALSLAGDRRAVPVLLEIARSGSSTRHGEKTSDLHATAAIALARIAGAETFAALERLARGEKDAKGAFGTALDRLRVARECGVDLDCYGKALRDPSWTRAEKAALAIGFSGDAEKGIPLLLAALPPLRTVIPERFPVHQAILHALTRLGTSSCEACIVGLEKHIEEDEMAVRMPGARDMLAQMRVTLAIIRNRSGARNRAP